MHLQTQAMCLHQRRHIRSDHRRNLRLVRMVEDLTEQCQVLVVDDRIDRQVALYATPPANLHDTIKVVSRKVVGRLSTHIQRLNAKVYTIRSSTYRSAQALIRPHRRHHLVATRITQLLRERHQLTLYDRVDRLYSLYTFIHRYKDTNLPSSHPPSHISLNLQDTVRKGTNQ